MTSQPYKTLEKEHCPTLVEKSIYPDKLEKYPHYLMESHP